MRQFFYCEKNLIKTYTYDVSGNITSKKVYDEETVLPKEEYHFTYDIKDPDRLTKLSITTRVQEGGRYLYDSYSRNYNVDEYGRPTGYTGNAVAFDSLGRLTEYDSTKYTYDINGVRLSKMVYASQGRYCTTTKYFMDGKKIMCSIDNNHTIWYNYDAKGIVGIKVDKTEYLFHRNALGDVTRIYKGKTDKDDEQTDGQSAQTDDEYELEARYEYDAWGNHRVFDANGVENTDVNFIGNINPIRYRGYYYDVDTGLYYLNARYYDPRLCRFISADETKYLDPNTVNGLNLYAYCGNNPVMNVDPDGHFALLAFLIGALIVVVSTPLVGAAVGGISAKIHGENVWKGVGNGAAIGAMIGLSAVLIATGVGTPLVGFLGASALIGAGVGSFFNLGMSLYSQSGSGGIGSLDLNQTFLAWGKGGIIGAVSGAAGHMLGQIGSILGRVMGLNLSKSIYFGYKISDIFSSNLLVKVSTFAGSAIGGFIGGNLINNGATNGNVQDKNIPLWLITILKFFGAM